MSKIGFITVLFACLILVSCTQEKEPFDVLMISFTNSSGKAIEGLEIGDKTIGTIEIGDRTNYLVFEEFDFVTVNIDTLGISIAIPNENASAKISDVKYTNSATKVSSLAGNITVTSGIFDIYIDAYIVPLPNEKLRYDLDLTCYNSPYLDK